MTRITSCARIDFRGMDTKVGTNKCESNSQSIRVVVLVRWNETTKWWNNGHLRLTITTTRAVATKQWRGVKTLVIAYYSIAYTSSTPTTPGTNATEILIGSREPKSYCSVHTAIDPLASLTTRGLSYTMINI